MTSGEYQISPPSVNPFPVICDMDTDGGGWTIIQRRTSGSLEFWNQTWQEYKIGFNNGLQHNYWLGLDRIHSLTTKDGPNVTLRIDIFHNRCPPNLCGLGYDPNGYWHSEWDFYIEGDATNYTMHVSIAKSGNLTSQDDQDLLHYFNNNRPFTTYDRDNDIYPDGNCAEYNFLGGWWHSWCTSFALNGVYDQTGPLGWGGYGFSCQHYYFWLDNYVINPAQSEMKIRRNSF
uniref:Fibrinogen C-terminal domain-containing protein n=1 Tax=Plectus sambesii TaxID=2011161 RepID=A0A914VSR8_9BILA